MNKLFGILYAILIVICTEAADPNVKECQVINRMYHNEYLYVPSFSIGDRRVREWKWRDNIWGFESKLKDFDDKDPQGVWQFIPIDGDNKKSDNKKLFYIKNSKYNEYMYSDNSRELFISARRAVYTSKIKSNEELDDKQYQWRAVKVYEYNNLPVYHIWNTKYEEALYGYYYKKNMARKVYTFADVPTNGQFEWYIRCRDNQELF